MRQHSVSLGPYPSIPPCAASGVDREGHLVQVGHADEVGAVVGERREDIYEAFTKIESAMICWGRLAPGPGLRNGLPLGGVLDPCAGTLRYASAGHEPPLLAQADGREEVLDSTGPVLGVAMGLPYLESMVILEAGDALLLMTDVVTEMRGTRSQF